jgi:hypothetical protein
MFENSQDYAQKLNVLEFGFIFHIRNIHEESESETNYSKLCVQSKGRARARPSKYIMLVSNSEWNQKVRIHREYQQVELISKEECYRPPPESMDTR